MSEYNVLDAVQMEEILEKIKARGDLMYIGGVNNKDEHFVDARDGVSYIVPRKLAEKLKLLVVVEVR